MAPESLILVIFGQKNNLSKTSSYILVNSLLIVKAMVINESQNEKFYYL